METPVDVATEAPAKALRVRMSIRELEKPENAEKWNTLLKAWQRIKLLPPTNPNSFWSIASYHGEPFKPRETPVGLLVPTWGGWCQHENVLFPTWHRFYVLRIEQALEAVCPGEDVTMAYWDQTSEESLKDGIPKTLTDDKVKIDGVLVPNPLKNFKLPRAIKASQADKYYVKPEGYVTVRYPFSGIRNPEKAESKADIHNRMIEDMCKKDGKSPVELLDTNIVAWLQYNHGKEGEPNGILDNYQKCLRNEAYNAFSNTSSGGHANKISLEVPHNSIHLAVGGYDLRRRCYGQIKGANGDMGENETAAFDPLFFFHHCNVDRVFWIWQKRHGMTANFEIDRSDKWGTNATERKGQGLTPNQHPHERLTMETHLHPFQNDLGVPVTSRDCINIEQQLGYTYSPGSLEDVLPAPPPPLMRISNIDKNRYMGSFLVRAYYKESEGESQQKVFFGQYPVLSRWNKGDCANCQHHLMVSALFDLTKVPDVIEFRKSPDDFVIEVVWSNPLTGGRETAELDFKENPGQDDPVMDFHNF